MDDFLKHKIEVTTRRDFLKKSSLGFGSIALSSILGPNFGSAQNTLPQMNPMAGRTPHFVPKAKRVIYLFQSGGPSQIETYDYKPALSKWHGKEIPPSLETNPKKFWDGRRSVFLSSCKINL